MSYSLTLAGIALANLLAIISPGPAFLLVSRTAASRSRALGLATGLGVAAATTLWAVAATFGVAVLMTRLTTLYGLVQLVGGAYLIWLGLSAWRDHGDAPSGTASAAAALGGTPSAMELRRAFLTGLSLTLTNPKVVVFFSSIFVAMLPAQAPLWVRLAALGIVAVQENAWYMLVACLFSQARMQAAYQRIKGGIDRVMGAVFIAFGARIVALARI
ncbi:MAG TPA: LysE family transporter [Alphaproteobacteria bacterium]|nr:LysE family transporter [Alphaproteobacteria bacterium]